MQRLTKKSSPDKKIYRSENHINQSNPNKLDVWLSRLSHLSQFGLFTLTIGAFYFTVIPLYKTAALEESIARREAELNATNGKLSAATASLEKVKSEIYERNRKDLIKGIVLVAPYCSGLMTPPSATHTLKDIELGQQLLKVDAAQCLQNEFEERKAETILTTDDYLILKSSIEIISANLTQMQKKALLDIHSVPEQAAKDPTTLAPLGPESKKVEEFDKLIDSIAPGLIDKNTKFQAAIDRTRDKIAYEYAESVQSAILKLLNINWQNSTQ
jgi:hypothetical protein